VWLVELAGLDLEGLVPETTLAARVQPLADERVRARGALPGASTTPPRFHNGLDLWG
jgi:hypothetical protein